MRRLFAFDQSLSEATTSRFLRIRGHFYGVLNCRRINTTARKHPGITYFSVVCLKHIEFVKNLVCSSSAFLGALLVRLMFHLGLALATPLRVFLGATLEQPQWKEMDELGLFLTRILARFCDIWFSFPS